MGENETERFIEYGSGLAGSLVGAASAILATSEPSAAIWGAPLGQAVESALVETSHRATSARRRQRVGAVVSLARDRLLTKLGEGGAIRTDAFMRSRLHGRSPLDDVIEHVIHASEGAFEERKLPHIAAVLANTALSSTVSDVTAHWVLTQVNAMSWTKLVALALIQEKDVHPLPSVSLGGRDTFDEWSVLRAFYELYYMDQMTTSSASVDGEGHRRMDEFKLSDGSALIYRLADLGQISQTDRRELLDTVASPLQANERRPD